MTTAQDFLKELDKKFWTTADKLRSNLDAAVCKHAVLRLTFLKYRKRVPDDVRKEKHRGTEDTEYSAVASSVPLCFKPFHPEIAEHGYVLTPGRACAEEVEDDGIPFADKMATLTSELADQFAESAKLEKSIRKNMKSLGFELPVGGKK